MKKSLLFLSVIILASCGSQDVSQGEQRTIQERVVAVKKDGSSTFVSAGRLDQWYKVNTPLTEGMIYEMTMEIPRVIKDPIFIPAEVTFFDPVEYLQRDLFGRYITKFSELKTAEKKPAEVINR